MDQEDAVRWCAENGDPIAARELLALSLWASGISGAALGRALGVNHQKALRLTKEQALWELRRQSNERAEGLTVFSLALLHASNMDLTSLKEPR